VVAVDAHPVRALRRHIERTGDLHRLGIDDCDRGGTLDVGEDPVGVRVVHRPAWPAHERDGCDDTHVLDCNHGGGAVDTGRFTEVEDVQVTPLRVVRQPVRVAANGHAAQ
jgi:hypothetical protein